MNVGNGKKLSDGITGHGEAHNSVGLVGNGDFFIPGGELQLHALGIGIGL